MTRVRHRAGAETNLISEEALRKPDQQPIDDKQQRAPAVRSDRERERRRHSALLDHLIARLLEQGAQRLEREELTMTEPKNAFAAVIELPEREHHSRDEERHVGRSDDDLRG